MVGLGKYSTIGLNFEVCVSAFIFKNVAVLWEIRDWCALFTEKIERNMLKGIIYCSTSFTFMCSKEASFKSPLEFVLKALQTARTWGNAK